MQLDLSLLCLVVSRLLRLFQTLVLLIKLSDLVFSYIFLLVNLLVVRFVLCGSVVFERAPLVLQFGQLVTQTVSIHTASLCLFCCVA
jgi:hypothetical protein